MFKNKNLLIITSGFPNNLNIEWVCVREQLLFLKKYFKNIYVIRPQYYINSKLDIFDIFPASWKEKPLRNNYKIDNIQIFFPKVSIFQPFKNWQIKKYIDNNNLKFDIIHSHFIYPSSEIWNYLKYKFNVKHVSTWHGFDVYKLPFKNFYWNLKIKNILKKCDKVITVSKKNIDFLEKLWVDKSKSILINNWYNSDKFYILDINKNKLRKKYNLPLNKKIIITVWNLVPVKNQELIIEAMKELNSKNNDYYCIIIWDWYLKHEFSNQIDNYSLDNCVKLLWKIDNEILINYFNASDLFVLPSFSEWNPWVMYESLWCWLPFVWSNISWIVDTIKNGKNWYIFKSDDLSNFVEKIELSFNTKWDKNKIFKSVENYSWEKLSKEIIKLYK